MKTWSMFAGVCLGVTAAAAVLALRGGGSTRADSGAVLSECDGQLRELVIHYEPSARDIALPVYREFLRALGTGAVVQVVCPDMAAFDELASAVGPLQCELRPLPVRHAITTWSRDRWVPLAPARPGAPAVLFAPRGEAADEIWPARAGDERVAFDLASASAGKARARRSALYFDGGDFLADGENVFVMPRVLQRNLQHTVANRELLLQQLAGELRKRVILLTNAPDHHAGMFMCAAGNRTLLVGDPSLSKPLLAGGAGQVFEADYSAETQGLFDAVAAQCKAEGYRVIRIPTAVAPDGRTYLTYVNGLIDEEPRGRTVYLPSYQGFASLNRAAQQVWVGLGYRVQPVDCSSVYRHFGCLHCLVNVLRRG